MNRDERLARVGVVVAFHLVLVALAVLAAGCASPAQPSAQPPSRFVASIEGVSRPLIVPDTVHAGVPFTALVVTSGGACNTPSGADLRTVADRADITPYDSQPAGMTACILLLVVQRRAVAITLPTPGVGAVALHAQRAGGLATVLARIVVQP
jgi:hypothetical protein